MPPPGTGRAARAYGLAGTGSAARPRDPQARKRHIDALLDYVRRRGAVLGIDPQLVTSRAELKDLFNGGDQAVSRRMLRGWRWEFMGDLSAVDGRHPGIGLLNR